MEAKPWGIKREHLMGELNGRLKEFIESLPSKESEALYEEVWGEGGGERLQIESAPSTSWW